MWAKVLATKSFVDDTLPSLFRASFHQQLFDMLQGGCFVFVLPHGVFADVVQDRHCSLNVTKRTHTVRLT
jgi:hypothetical protein